MKRAFLITYLAALAACSDGISQTPPPTDWAVSWSMPTQYTDGSALPVADIASTTITWTVNGGASQSKIVIAPATSATIAKVPGTSCFTAHVTTTATAAVPTATGQATSPPLCMAFKGPPKAPGNLTIN